MAEVSVVRCDDYNADEVKKALESAVDAVNGFEKFKPGMRVVIKANLVSAIPAAGAATTHPTVICALCDILSERGAGEIVIGDSPGGLYNSAFVGRVYSVTGMHEAEKHGAVLNRDFGEKKAEYPEAAVLKEFYYTSYLDGADFLINFCKLKSHGMMGMSAAAKNMFGAVPGILKPEYHYKYPKHEDFARMIIDLDEFFKSDLSVCDAIVAMEGNGPTKGTPRKLGALLASPSPHLLDLAAARLMGLTRDDVPTLEAAFERKLIPALAGELDISGSLDDFAVSDFNNVADRNSIVFHSGETGLRSRLLGSIYRKALCPRPVLKPKECVGCEECFRICPAKAIVMKDKKPVIDRKSCIMCFCCQEFCPKGALKVKRPAVARIITPEK